MHDSERYLHHSEKTVPKKQNYVLESGNLTSRSPNLEHRSRNLGHLKKQHAAGVREVGAVPAGSTNPESIVNFAGYRTNFIFSGSKLPGSGRHFPGAWGKFPRRGTKYAN